MITSEELEVLIDRGREQRAVEFKEPWPRTNKMYMAKVARAVIAMSNQRDGGLIILGVEDVPEFKLVGMSPSHLDTWKSYDVVAEALGQYCDPPIAFDLGILTVRGVTVVVLEVEEFATVPTLAARDYQGALKKGEIYVRGLTKNESTGHPSSHELRAVLDLATEKGVRRFLEMAQRSGMPLPGADSSDDQQFEEQLGDML